MRGAGVPVDQGDSSPTKAGNGVQDGATAALLPARRRHPLAVASAHAAVLARPLLAASHCVAGTLSWHATYACRRPQMHARGVGRQRCSTHKLRQWRRQSTWPDRRHWHGGIRACSSACDTLVLLTCMPCEGSPLAIFVRMACNGCMPRKTSVAAAGARPCCIPALALAARCRGGRRLQPIPTRGQAQGKLPTGSSCQHTRC